jgi:hypothetical protein
MYSSRYWVGYSYAYESLVKLMPTVLIIILNILVLRYTQHTLKGHWNCLLY